MSALPFPALSRSRPPRRQACHGDRQRPARSSGCSPWCSWWRLARSCGSISVRISLCSAGVICSSSTIVAVRYRSRRREYPNRGRQGRRQGRGKTQGMGERASAHGGCRSAPRITRSKTDRGKGRHAGGENAGTDARGHKASLYPRGVRLRLSLTDAELRAHPCVPGACRDRPRHLRAACTHAASDRPRRCPRYPPHSPRRGNRRIGGARKRAHGGCRSGPRITRSRSNGCEGKRGKKPEARRRRERRDRREGTGLRPSPWRSPAATPRRCVAPPIASCCVTTPSSGSRAS